MRVSYKHLAFNDMRMGLFLHQLRSIAARNFAPSSSTPLPVQSFSMTHSLFQLSFQTLPNDQIHLTFKDRHSEVTGVSGIGKATVLLGLLQQQPWLAQTRVDAMPSQETYAPRPIDKVHWDTPWRLSGIANLAYNAFDQEVLGYFRTLNINPEAHVFVPASGMGYLGETLLTGYPSLKISGFDLSEKSVSFSTKRINSMAGPAPDAAYYVGNVTTKESWELAEPADVVISGGLFTYSVLSDDESRFAFEFAQLKVKPGGYLFFYGLGDQRVNQSDFPPSDYVIIQTFSIRLKTPFLIVKRLG